MNRRLGNALVLSNAARKALKRMKAAEDADDLYSAEIVCEGRECYVGLDRIAKATVFELLRYVLIHDDSEQGKGVERYTLNEEGRAILADPNYQPKILAALRESSGDSDA